MGLHSSIPDNMLSNVLRKPLVFGNRKQISALHDLEIMIQEMQDEANKSNSELLRLYNVEIEYSGTFSTEILAKNETAAKILARARADLTSIDLDESDISTDEIGYAFDFGFDGVPDAHLFKYSNKEVSGGND